MKKKVLLASTTALLASIVISGSIMAATGKIKLVVDGNEVPTDAAPKAENGRVMVPISTVSKALGANVQWDAKSNSVIVNSKQDVWDHQMEYLSTGWDEIRNLIASYVAYYESKKDGYKDLVSDKFKSDFVDPTLIISKKDEPLLDYQFVDVKFNGTPEDVSQFTVRVDVVQYTDVEVQPANLVKKQLDFDVRYDQKKGMYVIDGIWVKGKQTLDSYTVFPGLTFKSIPKY